MERDFMGLAVKQEIIEEAIDAAPLRSSKMQWPVSNKTSSSVPQLLSFHASQAEKPKTGFDSLASSGLVTITTTETFDSSFMQKSNFAENQGGVRYTVTTYPTKHHDGHMIHHPVNTQTNLTGLHRQNLIGSVSPQPISAVAMPNPVPVIPSSTAVVGTTDLRNTSKIPGAPAQLTIFYNGSVCVYDNVSAEKAQAIMLLAGNGPPTIPNTTSPVAQVQASMAKPAILESFVVNHPYGSTPHRSNPGALASSSHPHRLSPTAIASSGHPHRLSGHVSQSPRGWPGTINNTAAPKQGGILVSANIVEPQKVVHSPGSISATFNIPSSTVPQFRRKSLARFLEKRKERVINTTLPYGNTQSPDCNSSGSCHVVQTVS